MDKLAREAKDGFLLMMIIFPTASPPTGQARIESNELTKRLAAQARLVVTVALGESLQMNVVRTVMRAMLVA